jgi:tRNA1(Val) A37 N6-methylase TrmN6
LIRQVFVGKGTGLFAAQEQETWKQAEARLRQALTDFAQTGQSTYQGRLFVQDALQGLRLIDLCREMFDVIVMNPPFGAVSLGVKDLINKNYAKSKNDLLAVFVERGVDLLRSHGMLGAITSRTCFFLSTFKKWRENTVLGSANPLVLADLGMGVMDDAMVEAAAYVLEKQ